MKRKFSFDDFGLHRNARQKQEEQQPLQYRLDLESAKCIPYIAHSTQVLKCRALNVHKGQLKLLLSEIDFLLTYAKPGDKIIYAGAANGSRIPVLDKMFLPLDLQWQLYDPCPFHADVHAWKRQFPARVQFFREPFLPVSSTDAGEGKRVLFISDIRTSSGFAKPDDTQVMENQALQMSWVLRMQPAACSLKFRGSFTYTPENKHFDYLKADCLSLQAWAPPNSTEIRLFASHPYVTQKYDSQVLEECMAYHNQHSRLLHKNDERLQAHILDRYHDCKALSMETKRQGLARFYTFSQIYSSRNSSSAHLIS